MFPVEHLSNIQLYIINKNSAAEAEFLFIVPRGTLFLKLKKCIKNIILQFLPIQTYPPRDHTEYPADDCKELNK